MFFRGLKKEILFVTLGLTFLTIIITAALGAYSTQTAGSDAERATSDSLINQSTDSLIQLAESTAKQQDIIFEYLRNDASNLALRTSNIYDNPSIFNIGSYWQFDKRVFRKDGRYLNNKDDISTFHIPSFVVLDAKEKQDIELTAYLDFIVPSMLTNNPNIAAIYTIDNKGVTRYFPNIVLGSLAPPDYDPRPDIYYKPAAPEENPGKKVIWSPLYEDVAGRGLMITASAPIYTKKGFEGIAGVDVFLKDIIKIITNYKPIEGSYAFLIDREGNTIAFPDKAYKDVLGRSPKKGEVRTKLTGSKVSPEFSAVLNKMMKGAKGFGSFHSGEKELLTAYAPLTQTGFSMAVVAEKATMLKVVGTLHAEISNSIRDTIVIRILPASLLIIMIATILSIFLVARVVKPIQELQEGVREIGSGNLDYNLKLKSKNEIGELASSFNEMSHALKKSRQELYKYSQSLEEKIKERTQQITEANERLKQLDKLKDDFVSLASHELRTPMTAIKSYLWMAIAGKGGPLNEKQMYYAQRSYTSVDRLIKLVNDMLNISRIESGRLTVQMQPVKIEQLVRETIEEVTPRAKELGVNVLIEQQGGAVPDVLADSDKIKEVIYNLIGNSMKFTPSGGKITVSFVEKDKMVEAAVKDTGSGIAGDDLPKLFQKFGILPGSYVTNQPVSGTGLGLYICRSLIELHGGKIWASSEGKGKGSTFTFSLKEFNQGDLDMFNEKYNQQVETKVGLVHTLIA